MNQKLYALFDKLTHGARVSHDGIPAAPLPFNKNHKIGVDEDGAPMFFVKTSRTMDAKFVELDLIHVRHNAVCSIHEEKATTRDVYTIIELRSANIDYAKYLMGDYFKHIEKANELAARVLGTEEKCGIYKITNKTNKLCYIGQAKKIRER